jgi:hypothetical protein
MSGRGVHIALTNAELDQLRAIAAEDQADYVANDLEEVKFGTADACETDKSWAYIHAALNDVDPDGPLVMKSERKAGFLARLFDRHESVDAGEAKFAIMGHEPLLSTEDYYIGLVDADKVSAVASALEEIPTEALGDRVRTVHQHFRASGSPEVAAEYVTGWYPGLVEFYRAAANARKHVIFTVDF